MDGIPSYRPRVDRRYRRCLSKITYATKREADRARRQIKWARGDVLTVYPCEDCGGFHLGHDKDE